MRVCMTSVLDLFYRRALDPEEQEMAYEIKSQLLKNVEIQNQKLKTEFTLHEKMTESRMLSQQNKRLHDDVTLSRANSMRLIKLFERKAKEGRTRKTKSCFRIKITFQYLKNDYYYYYKCTLYLPVYVCSTKPNKVKLIVS